MIVLVSFVLGAALAPLLLPWLPGRAFSVKGVSLGLPFAVLAIAAARLPLTALRGRMESVSWLLLVPAIVSFCTMNFTGSSTYTSMSGVRREMRIAVPAQLVAATCGLCLWFAARFV